MTKSKALGVIRKIKAEVSHTLFELQLDDHLEPKQDFEVSMDTQLIVMALRRIEAHVDQWYPDEGDDE